MISAVIFDLDGTVLDNEGIWREAFNAVIKSESLLVKPDKHGWIHEPGIGVNSNWVKLIGAGERAEQLSKKTWEVYWEIVGDASSLPVMEGLVDLVSAIKDRGWQTALATGSEWTAVEKELEELNLYLAFDVTTTGEEVLESKPSPEIYLLTSTKLGVDPSECLVIEDALAGVRSAAAAGAQVIGIKSEYASESELKKAGANLVVATLAEVVVGLAEHGNQQEEPSNSN